MLSCLIPQSTSPMWTIKLLLVLLLLHTFNRDRFLIGYDSLLITSLLRDHLCVTPIKDDGSSHCGWDNISTYLHLSQKQIKTDMWAVCHTDTWSFPRKPAKSSECCWVITFWFSLTTRQASGFHHCSMYFRCLSWHRNVAFGTLFYFTDSLCVCPHALWCFQDVALWSMLNWWDLPQLLLWQWPLTEYFWAHWPLAVAQERWPFWRVKHICCSLKKKKNPGNKVQYIMPTRWGVLVWRQCRSVSQSYH